MMSSLRQQSTLMENGNDDSSGSSGGGEGNIGEGNTGLITSTTNGSNSSSNIVEISE
jgi:hypothetical protein